jgi:dihydrofolate synthase / folylpolyglutamate synthase
MTWSWTPLDIRGKFPNIRRLEAKPPWDGKTIQGLHAPRVALEALGDPQNKVPAIHITGTNGKGTVSALVCATLISSGKRVAQFVSPHLQDLRERLLLQGAQVSAERFDAALGQVFEIEENEKINLSSFEAVIVASHLVCAEDDYDFQVVEVGLGGRLDATNLMSAPLITAITSIGLDHTNILGPTEAHIAREKAGIFRPGVPAVIGPVSEMAREAIVGSAPSNELHFFGERFYLDGEVVRSGDWECWLPVQERKLVTRYQRENFTVGAYISHLLGILNSALQNGMLRMRWPGRLEEHTHEGREILLDGAHNPDGMRGLLEYLGDEEQLVVILSILEGKDLTEMGKIFKEWNRKKLSLFFVPMELHKSAPLTAVREAFGTGEICANFSEAFERAGKVPGKIVITGSLYFVGEVRSALGFGEIRAYV